ncbi:MAG: RNA methyltransferase [Bacteroidales bacterium]|jgi:TrmH family RNA methyltransferase|nr:RNA methyltransferase [Bacteroidales bacterium]
MISKTELKRLTAYKQSKYRNADSLFVVEGVKMTEELLASCFEPIAVYAVQSWFDENERLIGSKPMPFYEISNEELERISLLSTPNKVFCLAYKPQLKPIKYENNLTIAIDNIKDPGNLGTIMRIADWFGIKDIVCSRQCVDVFNPKVVQASMGSIFRVNVLYEDLENVLQSLPKNFPIYGTIVENGTNIYQTDLSSDGIIVIGSESFGISEQIKTFVNQPLSIPRLSLNANKPESLNASVATAIIVSEFRRRLAFEQNILLH